MYKYDLADMMLICVDKKKLGYMYIQYMVYSIWYIYTHGIYII